MEQQPQDLPHEKILDKIAELLQFAYDNAQKPVSEEKLKQVEAQLDALEPQVAEFVKLSEVIAEGSGLTDYALEMMKIDQETPLLNEAQKQLMARGNFLKSEAQAAAKDLVKASQDAKAESKELVEKKKKKPPRSRKGKFRSLGGNKDWKPL